LVVEKAATAVWLFIQITLLLPHNSNHVLYAMSVLEQLVVSVAVVPVHAVRVCMEDERLAPLILIKGAG
jgi:hypothetical protein